MGFGDEFHFYNYISDDGATYAVKLSDNVAGQGGFIQASGTPTNGYPYGPKNMRHVWGEAADGLRARIPIASAGNTKFTTGGDFTLHGVSYTIQGRIGEQRKLSSLGG